MGWLPFLQKDKQKDKQRAGTSDDKAFLRPDDEPVSPRRTRRKTAKDNQPVDPVLPEKKRARRRLIGAVALVLAAVIGLPMLLDSEPKPLSDDVAIDIPPKDRAFLDGASRQSNSASASAVAPASGPDKGDQPGTPAAAAASSSHGSPASAPSAPLPSAPVAAAASPLAGAASTPATQPEAHALKAPERKPEPKPEQKDQQKPVQAAEQPSVSHGAAAPSGKTEASHQEVAKAGEQKSSKFVIQVAALASQDKVNELRGKLKAAGVHSYTQKVATQGGDRIRVRVGPFTSRDDAERMRVRLAKLGLRSSLLPV